MRVSLTRDASNAATARAEVSVEMGDESVVVFAYTVQPVEREGRWEVTDAGGRRPPVSEPMDDPDDEPSVPPALAATGGGTSSPTTNP